MKNPMTKFAAAAVIAIAAVIGALLWKGTGSGVTLADVVARVEQVQAVRYEMTQKSFGSEDPNELWMYNHYALLISQEYGKVTTYSRRDPNGEEITASTSYDYPNQKRPEIEIKYIDKTYRRDVPDSQEQDETPERQEGSIYSLRETLHTEHESIGRSVIDGVEVEGFRMTANPDHRYTNYLYKGPRFLHRPEQQFETTLWVDVKTLLPVRIKYLTSVLEVPDGDGDARIFLQQVDDAFQWDIHVDASEFEAPPIPEGYAIQDDFPEPADEEDAIEGLRQCVELFGDHPEKINLTYLWAESETSQTSAALQLKEELEGLTGLERDDEKMDALKPIRLLNKFYLELVDDNKDPAYYGETVQPGEADKVLMRWRLDDGQYRVIFGDLSARTVTAEALAELEGL